MKTTQKDIVLGSLGSFLVKTLCSDSYALVLFEKKQSVTDPVRKTSFPTFLVGIKKWTRKACPFFKTNSLSW
jgi:hypothetical protein